MIEPKLVVIRPLAEDGRRLWTLVLSLARELGPKREWSLIGGLMVQLHAFEHEDAPRPTADIDLLGGAKRPPRMTETMASLLVERGAEVADPPRSDSKLGYRFELEGETVELLGPDGLRGDPKTIAGLRTFQAAGGSQALRRTEVVLVSLGGREPIAVRRPNLLGAILIKARVVVKKRKGKFESDRQDLVRLLSYVDDPRTLRAELSRKEPAWLRDAEAAIDFDDPDLAAQFRGDGVARARQALGILAQDPDPASSTK
ncbi:MAG TPA: hypothetical protein VHA76_08715 [Solirubrobacterales bacterium]|nr:hypothetical protein [Solirubrobacterales bacterium]